ncbi:NAD(P)-dependent oxidoreductase [Halobacteriovorax sp. HLS]|uniref:NAD-dependent epimerase/dehydratase family protein n=1 Tax=Halobacteriovorax sp. HLS TaxID=2234000 RepID=UPI000FD9D6FA|nr:NAD(P)-dependent oxidoreductase [Halobacteriovorax sp. HLS]
MKVLVTGGAGYIGSTLVPMLLDEGHQVTVIDNFMFKQNPLLDQCHKDNLTIINGDVRNEELMLSLIPGHDVLIPLACLVGAPLCNKDPMAAKAVNTDAIKFLYDNKSDNQMLIYPCTNSGYGIGEADIFCDESSPLKPISLYGKLKVETESYLLTKGEAVCFRFATVFGSSPRMRLDLLVNDFTYKAINDGYIILFESHFKRNYLHVRDAAKAFIHTINNYNQMKGNTYNVGLSTANLSKKELCDEIKKFVPNFMVSESEIGKDPDQRNYIVSNEKIEATGYKTDYSLQDGIKELQKAFSIIKRTEYANI